MGVLIDLGETRQVTSVQVDLARSGATIELRWGKDDPGSSASGDAAVEDSPSARIDETVVNARTRVCLLRDRPGADPVPLVWLTKLPPPADGADSYRIEVLESPSRRTAGSLVRVDRC